MSNIRRQVRRQRRYTAADEPFFLARSLAGEFSAGQSTDRHAHAWGQLIYCSAGVMTVWTETGSWVAPPNWAVWAPPQVAHQIRFAGACSLRTLYLRADVASALPRECAVMTVSPLLRELVLRTVGLGMLDEREPGHRAMAELIAAELERHDAPPFDLPTPTSAPVRRAAEMLADPTEAVGVSRLARAVGLSPRTLERRFLAETGMSIAGWGRQARLLQALRRLADGDPVKVAAAVAGYSTPSGFVAAFRSTFGRTPGRYFADA